ncbi:MAG: hypothetical protein ABC585_05705 [Candidatus Methanosuratincola petrocarbonis]
MSFRIANCVLLWEAFYVNPSFTDVGGFNLDFVIDSVREVNQVVWT